MRMIACTAMTLSLLAVSLPASGESVYWDPDGYYTLSVPAGWNVETQSGGVSLVRGLASASFLKMKGQGTPESLVAFISDQVTSQADLVATGSGHCQFGGRAGFCAGFEGVAPKGWDEIMKIVSTTDSEYGYAMIATVPTSDFEDVKADLEQIEKGFRLSSPSGS
jgi:hypothetical protein